MSSYWRCRAFSSLQALQLSSWLQLCHLPEFLKQLSSLLESDQLLTDPADCRAYGYDNSTLQGQPLAGSLAACSIDERDDFQDRMDFAPDADIPGGQPNSGS